MGAEKRNEIRVVGIPNDIFKDIKKSAKDNERTIQAEALFRLKNYGKAITK